GRGRLWREWRGTIAGPDRPASIASALASSRRSPSCFFGPWHWMHDAEKIGRMSRAKSTLPGEAGGSPSAAGAASTITRDGTRVMSGLLGWRTVVGFGRPGPIGRRSGAASVGRVGGPVITNSNPWRRPRAIGHGPPRDGRGASGTKGARRIPRRYGADASSFNPRASGVTPRRRGLTRRG